METKLIDLHSEKFNKDLHVRIDRRSEWGNPFELHNRNDEAERIEVLWKYTLYLLRDQKLLNKIRKLNGKTLACWCYPKHKCHGQVLIYILAHLDIVDKCRKPSCDREEIAEEIFQGLGWTRVKKYEQQTLF